MGILKSFIFLLIAGILSSTTARSNSSARIPPHLHLLGYFNTTLEDIEEFDKELCKNNGGPDAHDAQKKSAEQYTFCTDTLQTEIIQEVLTHSYDSENDRDKIYYKSYCSKAPKYGDCVKNLTDSMKTCLHSSKHESADIVYRSFNTLTEFACENDAARITKFNEEGGNECISSKYVDILGCANQTVIKFIHKTIADGAAIGGIGSLHLLVPDVDKCTIVDKFQTCIINALKGCPQQTAANLGNSLFNLLKKVSTCDRFLKSQASPGNVVNLLLISAITAMMSLRFV